MTSSDPRDPHRGQPVYAAGRPLAAAAGAVVMVHGRGATAQSILELAREFDRDDFAYLAPQAAGHSWYPYSFLAPLDTAPVFMAGLLQSYILEEWVHHSVHFCRFRNPYFRYIKRHHLYHHSPKGSDAGFGLTNGFWDVVLQTRFPVEARRALYARRAG